MGAMDVRRAPSLLGPRRDQLATSVGSHRISVRRAARSPTTSPSPGQEDRLGYVERHSAYSFLDGASHPEELALRGGARL